MDVVEKEVVYFCKDERKCCQGHEWMRIANFFLVVYVGISRKMERCLMWKYLKRIFLFIVYITMSEDGGRSRSKV